jgi:dipeptidyl-peptidase-3
MAEEPFQWLVERFDDISILRYQVPGWEKLTLQQKKLAYYLAEAGYSGRDIVYHQVQSAVREREQLPAFFL